jgi:hypothetical protein
MSIFQSKHWKFFVVCFLFMALPALAAVAIDASFSNFYPEPWWSTFWGKAAISFGVAIAVAGAVAFTVATAGTGGAMLGAAGSWITAVGSMVGMAAGVGTGAAAAGLAILGGGTVAAGGFGIAGGAFVVAALTGAATGVITDVSIDVASKMIIKEPYRRYEFIKVPMIEEHGTDDVKNLVAELKEIEDKLASKEISPDAFGSETKRVSAELVSRLSDACNFDDESADARYNAVNAAILFFNLGDEKKSLNCINKLEFRTNEDSFLSYLHALNQLTTGDYQAAFKELDITIAREPSALQPYILYTMALNDKGEYRKALKIAGVGLENVSQSNFQLLYTSGDAAFRLEDFSAAAEWFEKAYSNISEDVIEADTAMMVAVSYYKSGDKKQGWEWYEKALNKLGSDNEEGKAAITARWSAISS